MLRHRINSLAVVFIVFTLVNCGAPPKVTTSEVIQITDITAQCGGTILTDASDALITRGVCWGTNPNPTIESNNTDERESTETGEYNSSLTGLKENTTYYVRAYATNSNGTSYGDVVVFKTESSLQFGTVTDTDGNTYETVRIGDQWWMMEDLKVKHFQNGESVPKPTVWNWIKSPAYLTKNIRSEMFTFYNWFAATDTRNIAPKGWRVPTNDDWQKLVQYLGGEEIAGKRMGSPGSGGGKYFSSGFSAKYAGWIEAKYKSHKERGKIAPYWSSTPSSPQATIYVINSAGLMQKRWSKNDGLIIRCVKD